MPVALAAVAAVFLSGCLVDRNLKCGENQDLNYEEYCVCKPGFVPSATVTGSCVPCPAGEVSMGDQCVCPPGQTRQADGVCRLLPMGLGDPCTVGTPNTCAVTPYTHCQDSSIGGYCTQPGCNADGECPTGYTCDKSGATAFCRRPPVGQGQSCMDNAGCAGTEATLCAAPFLPQCLVEGCQLAPNDCSPGYTCCDLTMLGLAKNLCLPLETCP